MPSAKYKRDLAAIRRDLLMCEKAEKWDKVCVLFGGLNRPEDIHEMHEAEVEKNMVKKGKLDRIRELLRNAPLPPGEALDEVLSIIDEEASG